MLGLNGLVAVEFPLCSVFIAVALSVVWCYAAWCAAVWVDSLPLPDCFQMTAPAWGLPWFASVAGGNCVLGSAGITFVTRKCCMYVSVTLKEPLESGFCTQYNVRFVNWGGVCATLLALDFSSYRCLCLVFTGFHMYVENFAKEWSKTTLLLSEGCHATFIFWKT